MAERSRGGGLDAGDAGLQSSYHPEPVHRALIAFGRVRHQLIEVSERHPEFGVEWNVEPVKCGRGDADHGERPAGKQNGSAKNRRVRAKTASPQAVAEHDHGRAVLVTRKAAAERQGKSGNIEIVGGGRLTPDSLRLSRAPNRGGDEVVISSDPGEGLGLVPHIAIDRPGEVVAALFVVGGVQAHQCARIPNRRGPKHKRADHRKDSGVRRDAKTDRNHDRKDEARRFRKAPDGMGQILAPSCHVVPPLPLPLRKTRHDSSRRFGNNTPTASESWVLLPS
jgi:hypothetical protein